MSKYPGQDTKKGHIADMLLGRIENAATQPTATPYFRVSVFLNSLGIIHAKVTMFIRPCHFFTRFFVKDFTFR